MLTKKTQYYYRAETQNLVALKSMIPKITFAQGKYLAVKLPKLLFCLDLSLLVMAGMGRENYAIRVARHSSTLEGQPLQSSQPLC